MQDADDIVDRVRINGNAHIFFRRDHAGRFIELHLLRQGRQRGNGNHDLFRRELGKIEDAADHFLFRGQNVAAFRLFPQDIL